jgi:hypothetical protein
MIRQGGWLLWDVPAQYGFLSTLAIAVVPLRSVWQSFYVLNALLNFGAALLVFGLLRGAAAGPARNAFALVVAETAVFLVPGAPWEASGPWFVPNVGAFRFFWCYALLALLVRMHHTVRDGGRPEPLLVLGSVVWIVAAFWSAESAAYTSLVWIPAFAAIVTARFHHAPRRAARWLALPVALLAGSVAVVEAVYRIRLGHGPDWRAFVDHVLAYTGFNTAPIMPGGTVLLLLLALWAIASTGGELIRRRAPVSALALAWGAWAMLYGTASYFVVRSHDSNATNLVPLACAALAAAVELLHEHGRRTVTAVVYAALVPLFATVPLLGLAEPSKLGRVALELSQGYVANVDALLPQDPYLHGIAVTAGLTTDDFIAYLDTGPHTNVLPPVPLASADGLRWVTMPRAWLPMPLTLLVALPEARATVYLERASARVGSGGWLIQPIAGPNARSFGWLLRWIHTTHRPVRSFENRRWRATRFEPIRG